MKVIIDGIEYVPKEKTTNKTLADLFEAHLGATEYQGIVSTIQKWYYGSVIKASWCATSVSYFLSRMGLLKYTLGEKQENVKLLYNALIKTGTAKKISKDEALKRGDILIYKWDKGEFTTTCSKHVSVCYENTPKTSKMIKSIGGNQNDSINVSSYSRDYLVCAFRPDYSKSTI